MDYQALGRRIKERRKALHLTQAQVASMAGLSISFCGHIERGTRKASIVTLIVLSRILETTPDALLNTGRECADSARSRMDQMEACCGMKNSRKTKARSFADERE